jgi:predicted restriction endonuclease
LGKNIKREVNVRDKQKIFREKVLNNFNRCCCLTGETTEELLIASHIIPWSKGEDNRVDPGNGLCLSWVYDKLFDRGYFTLEDDLRIQISPRIKYLSKLHQKLLIDIGQAEIRKPIQYDLNPQCLEFHRKYIFK